MASRVERTGDGWQQACTSRCVTKRQVFPAWGQILRGRKPFLSIEITRQCPLKCPGCYAFSPGHVASVSDLTGDALVEGVLELKRRLRPVHISIVGGEPLVRYRELNTLLPLLADVEVQVVTSAVRPIPAEWAGYRHVHLAVSVDGLPAEHDRRRAPATYERLLRHIREHRVIIHCTVTRQMLGRPGYLRQFAEFWSARPEARKIWFSLYTPQEGDRSEERLSAADRVRAVSDIARVAAEFRKVHMPAPVLDGYLYPPSSPAECVFAQVTTCLSADLRTEIGPCEFGGTPVCRECGCMASAGMAAVARHRLGGLVPVGDIFKASKTIGRVVTRRTAVRCQ